MNRTTVTCLAWIAAAGAGVGFAMWYPTDATVMGQLPAHSTQSLARAPVSLPDGLPSDRTLALVTFNRDQRSQADSWIEGLNLKNDASISWVRIPVLGEPNSPDAKSDTENRLLGRYTADMERAKMLPMFIDKAAFAKATGLNSTESAYAVVLNRQGEVLARVEGPFDPNKAMVLRETLAVAAK
ncbi:MAG: hypothetical protein ACK5A0_00760 [Polaromonas sp.]|jgi:hypothetical protein